MSVLTLMPNAYQVRPPGPVTPLPGAPTSLVGSGKGDGMTASWAGGTDADSTDWELTQDGTFASVAYSGNTEGDSYAQTVDAAGTWYFRIRSVNGAGTSSWVSTSFVVLPPPGDISYTPASESTGTLNWSYNAISTGTSTTYDYEVRRDGELTTYWSGSVAGADLRNASLPMLFSERLYEVRMRSRCGALVGAWSEFASVAGPSGRTTIYSRDYVSLSAAVAAMDANTRLVLDSMHVGTNVVLDGSVLQFCFCAFDTDDAWGIFIDINSSSWDAQNANFYLENFYKGYLGVSGNAAYKLNTLTIYNNSMPLPGPAVTLDISVRHPAPDSGVICNTLDIHSVTAAWLRASPSPPTIEAPGASGADIVGNGGSAGLDGYEADAGGGGNGDDVSTTPDPGNTGPAGFLGYSDTCDVSLHYCTFENVEVHSADGGEGGAGGNGGNAIGGSGGPGGNAYSESMPYNGGNGGNGGNAYTIGGQGADGGPGGSPAATTKSLNLYYTNINWLYRTAHGGVGGQAGAGGYAVGGVGGGGGLGVNGGSNGVDGSGGTDNLPGLSGSPGATNTGTVQLPIATNIGSTITNDL